MDLIPVKKSTPATWCRDIDLTDEQISAIRERRAPEPGIPRNTQRKRHREIELIGAQAKLEAERLVDDPFWVTGLSMYRGDGFKTQSSLGIADADPFALRLFKRWSDRYQRLGEYRARLNLHADNDELAARRWWARELSPDLADLKSRTSSPTERDTGRIISQPERV